MSQPLSRRRFVGWASAAALAGTASAQSPALESLKIICGFPPGGTTDLVARSVAEQLAGSYARTAVVENRAGAGGRLAADAVRQAAADGSVMLLTPGSMLFLYPHIYKQLPYNPFADFVPVSVGANNVHALAVGPMVPEAVRTVPDLLAWWRAHPKRTHYASPGAGSTPHFIGSLVERAAGVQLTHVSYKGVQLAITDLLGGQLPVVIGPEGNFLPHLASGKLRVLATSGPRRSKFEPQVPTFQEQGLKDINVEEWFGFFMPARTPADMVQRAAAAIGVAIGHKPLTEGFARMGMEAAASTPTALAARLKADHDFWVPVVKASGFSAES